ncbi:MAG: hypothetical protein ACRD3W_14785 [Terriglobales bacterium]
MADAKLSNIDPLPEEDELLPRSQTCASIPFFLRAWWMSDYKSEADTIWQPPTWLTSPIASAHTDPFCDAGSMDFDL